MQPSNARKKPDPDRRVNQAVRLARLFKILQLLTGNRRYNARDLAEELECSEKTVQRYLATLELAGVPWWYDERGRCYRIRPDFRVPRLNLTDAYLTEDEVLGQAVATVLSEAAGLKIGQGARPTTDLLAAAASEDDQQLIADATQLIHVLDLRLAEQTQRHHDTIRTAQWALLRKKWLAGRYRSPHQEKAVRLQLHPYRLALKGQAWYLIARPESGDQPQTYRIARFKSLRMTDADAEVPADFDLDGYFGKSWSVYRGDRTHDVEVRFTKDAADLVTETKWHPTQSRPRKHPDGSVTLTFQVDGLNEVLWWLLGWSGRVKVVRPPELRELVLEQLRAAIKLNEG